MFPGRVLSTNRTIDKSDVAEDKERSRLHIAMAKNVPIRKWVWLFHSHSPPNKAGNCSARGILLFLLFAIPSQRKQCLLRPAQSWAMDTLRLIPMGGTYDQRKPLALLLDVNN